MFDVAVAHDNLRARDSHGDMRLRGRTAVGRQKDGVDGSKPPASGPIHPGGARANARADAKLLYRLFRFTINDVARDHQSRREPKDIFLAAGHEGPAGEIHSFAGADVSLEFVERGFVPLPEAILVRVLADVIEFEILKLAAPLLKENPGPGDRLAFFI